MTPEPRKENEACGHEPPQSEMQLHGICIFCYRDRLGVARKENRNYEAKLAEIEKRLVCSFCGGTDLVCGKGHIEATDELKKRARTAEAKLSQAEAVLEKVWLAVEQASRLRCSCHMAEKCLYCKAKQSIQTYREGK